MSVVIGVDAGTTVTKAVAFADGVPAVTASRATAVQRCSDGRVEQDQGEVVASVLEVLAEVAAHLGPRTAETVAIGLTGQGDGLWLTDAYGFGVGPAMSWLDARANAVVETWHDDGTSAEIAAVTGSEPFPGATPALLAWVARERPDLIERAAVAGHCKDMLFARLTGARATEPSNAILFDHRSRTSSAALVERCDLGAARELIAPVAVDPTGALLPAVAESVGLPAGLPVVSAPYDLVASATGAGVERNGEGLLIVGTTLACEVLHEEVTLTGERAGLTLATGTGTAAFRAMPAMVGAATIDWVLGIVGHTVHDLPALLAEPPSTAVRALPFLAQAGERAPFRDPRARGRFDGITLTTTAADLVRAVVEALAFSARSCFEAAGLDGRLRACGGGARGPLAQVFADALDAPIDRCTDPEVGARGAAIHAARVVGAEPPPPSPTDLVSPHRPHAMRYAEAFGTYLADVDAARAQWAGTPVPTPTRQNS